MVVAVSVSLGRVIPLECDRRRALFTRARVLLVIRLQRTLLHRLGKRVDRVSGFLLPRLTADAERVPPNLHRPFRADEHEGFTLVASIDEVHAQSEIESFT